MYNQVVPWMMQNRGNFDVFVHPNSGFEREDHHDWGMWYAICKKIYVRSFVLSLGWDNLGFSIYLTPSSLNNFT